MVALGDTERQTGNQSALSVQKKVSDRDPSALMPSEKIGGSKNQTVTTKFRETGAIKSQLQSIAKLDTQ